MAMTEMPEERAMLPLELPVPARIPVFLPEPPGVVWFLGRSYLICAGADGTRHAL